MLNLNLTSIQDKPLTNEFDVIIIGAGPAGLTAAIYTSRANLKTIIIHTEESQLSTDHEINNFPGFESISGKDLLKKIWDQTEKLGVSFVSQGVVQLNLKTDPKIVTLRDGTTLTTSSVILAMGRGKRKKEILGEKRLSDHGISYCSSCDGPLYKGRQVVAIGNPNEKEVFDDIMLLKEMGCNIIVLTEESISDSTQILTDRNIHVIEEVRVNEILGKDNVEGVSIEHSNGEEEVIQVDAVFIFGSISPTMLLAQAGIDDVKPGCISIDHSCKTNLEGVYAAGDITCSGFQAIIAAGQGARAGMQVIKFLRRKKRSK